MRTVAMRVEHSDTTREMASCDHDLYRALKADADAALENKRTWIDLGDYSNKKTGDAAEPLALAKNEFVLTAILSSLKELATIVRGTV